jgi:hypothetical protein
VKVVDADSATLGWPDEVRIPIDGNHRTMCRFADIDELRFKPVWTSIRQMASQAKMLGKIKRWAFVVSVHF